VKVYLNNKNEESLSKEVARDYHNLIWRPYNSNNQEFLNETIITLRLTKKHYKTAYALAHMLGFNSLDDYVSHMVVQNLEMEIRGGDIDIDKENTLLS
jgi:hypothetical protein